MNEWHHPADINSTYELCQRSDSSGLGTIAPLTQALTNVAQEDAFELQRLFDVCESELT